MAELLPVERIALTVAKAQVERGENPPINTTTVLVMALDRLTAPPDDGVEDWRCPDCGHLVDTPMHELGCPRGRAGR